MLKRLKVLVLMFVIIGGCSPVFLASNQKRALDLTPSPGRGYVTGQLVVGQEADLTGLIVYLGEAIEINGQFTGGVLNTSTAPYASVDPLTGRFLISDVAPGKYILVIYEVIAGGRAYQDESGNIVTLDIQPNETLDLGTIEFYFGK